MAPPNPRVVAAFRAMTALGIKEAKVKPVLKKLLKLYDKNWELIEEENYRALIDAIFEEEDAMQEEKKKEKDVNVGIFCFCLLSVLYTYICVYVYVYRLILALVLTSRKMEWRKKRL